LNLIREKDSAHHVYSVNKIPFTSEILDKCLGLLQMAMLIEQKGENVTITTHGIAAAAKLGSTPAANSFCEEKTPTEAATDAIQRGGSYSLALKWLRSLPSSEKNFGLQLSQAANRARHIKYKQLLIVAAAMLIVIAWNYVRADDQDEGTQYRFADVRRGELKIFTVTTGRIEAVDSVEVSSQLSGQVVKLFVDFNDKVPAGAPLAQLDDKTYKAAVAEAEARLAHANASYDAAGAKIAGTKARYDAADAAYKRKNVLKKHGGISTQELDKSHADMVTAESEMNAARADEAVQAAAVNEAKAALLKAQIALARTVIRSPIAGTVIKRDVELGQTVAVSMKAPTMFTIARDLSHMRVHARVDEADIGQIRVGQKVQFSVDSYPDRTFAGEVIQIHRAPKVVQNVVTYTVVITAENPDFALLPGMTAIARIVTTERPHALLVPSAALRFHPENEASESSNPGSGADKRGSGSAQVWIRTKLGRLKRAGIGIGKSNGRVTEVVSGPLTEGQVVVVGKRFVRNEKKLFGISLGL
jgi:HlyD family secretion protein